jgi:hypothetical protein
VYKDSVSVRVLTRVASFSRDRSRRSLPALNSVAINLLQRISYSVIGGFYQKVLHILGLCVDLLSPAAITHGAGRTTTLKFIMFFMMVQFLL